MGKKLSETSDLKSFRLESLKRVASKLKVAAAIVTLSGGVVACKDSSSSKVDYEKCYGVVKKGKNGCGDLSGTHSCAGAAKVDGSKEEWIFLPKGVCNKLAGGALEGDHVTAEQRVYTIPAEELKAKIGSLEKCYGVAAKSFNDGTVLDPKSEGSVKKFDREKNAFVYVPKGICSSLVGGFLRRK